MHASGKGRSRERQLNNWLFAPRGGVDGAQASPRRLFSAPGESVLVSSIYLCIPTPTEIWRQRAQTPFHQRTRSRSKKRLGPMVFAGIFLVTLYAGVVRAALTDDGDEFSNNLFSDIGP